MAETSRFWTTNDIGDGPAAGYDQDLFADFLTGVFSNGVLRGVALELKTTGYTSPITIEPGAAIAAGRYYQNSALLQLPVTTPSVGTTAFNLVLAAVWTTQEVRLEIIMQDDGSVANPVVVDNPGTRVETLLYHGTIDLAGNISLSDARVWAVYSTTLTEGIVNTRELADEAVDSEHIRDYAIWAQHINPGAVTTEKILNYAINAAKIAPGAVTNEKISPSGLNVLTGDIVDAQITRSKLGDNAARMIGHKGAQQSNWSAPGENFYTDSLVEMQCGSYPFDFGESIEIFFYIYFPLAYIHGAPLGFITMYTEIQTSYECDLSIAAITESYIQVSMARKVGSASYSGRVFWFTMGGPIL